MVKSRRRLTVGMMMILVAAVAFGVWAVQYSRRIRLVFDNQSIKNIHNLTVSYGSSSRYLGQVEPQSKSEWRIAASPTGPVRVSWDVEGRPGQKNRHIEAPGMTASGPGGLVEVSWQGK